VTPDDTREGRDVARRDPADVLDEETGKVRILRQRCSTCVFRPGDLMLLGPERFRDLIDRNLAAGAMLTCHQTLPYSDNPDFGPAVCAGFWARHGLSTAAGRIAAVVIGLVRIAPPAGEGK
jgi:hypothetical protein